MRVLLVSLNRETFPTPVMPVGVLHIAANLRTAGHDVRFLDLCFSPVPAADLRATIADFKPGLIGFSLRNLENHVMTDYRSYLPEARDLIQTAMRSTTAPTVAGGASFSLFPCEATAYLKPTYGLAGEAEHTVVELVRRLETGEPVGDIPGLCQWRDGQVVDNRAEQITDFTQLPLPALDLFDRDAYRAAHATWGVETKRGCEFRCAFCAESAKHEHYRLREPRLVVDEMEAAVSLGLKRLSIVDGIFNHPADHAVAVCEEILRRGLKVRWSGGLTPVGLTAEILDIMKRAGYSDASLGLDAASTKMLRVYQKAFTADDALRAFKLLAQAGIPFITNVLLGGPGETMETIAETMSFLETIPQPRMVLFAMGIRIYPGTTLELLARADGWSEGDQGIAAPRYYFSSALPADAIDRIEQVCRTHDNWFTPRKEWELFRPRS